MALDRYGDVLPRSILKPRSAGDGNPVYVALSFADEPDLVRLQDAMRRSGIKAEWQDPGLFHCSLLIVEDATDEQLNGLLDDLSLPVRFWAEVASLGTFEADDIPLIANVVANPALIRLQQEFAAAALRQHLPVFEFFRATGWKPHITLGYDSDADIEALPPIPAIIKLRAEAVLLMRDDYNVVRRILLPETMPDRAFIEAGGKGSGHFGHAGIPGHQGGSLADDQGEPLGIETVSLEQFISSPIPGYEYDPEMGGEKGWGEVLGQRRGGRNEGERRTALGPGFFALDAERRAALLHHEVGHDLGWFFNQDFQDVARPFELAGGVTFDNPFGASKEASEMLADAYAALWAHAETWYEGDSDFGRNFNAFLARVRAVARRENLPVPARFVARGGPRSGFYGHAGRPGEVGGSLPSGEPTKETSPKKNGQLDGSLAAIERQYPEVEEGERVDGREVRGPVSNWDSVSASLEVWESLPGYRIVKMSQFTDLDPNEPPTFYSQELRESTEELARAMKVGQWIEPLIVAVDDRGPWVIEGSHRFDALRILNAKAFPAIVVIDRQALPDPDVVQRHYGPGAHPGTGTDQSVHGGGGVSEEPRMGTLPKLWTKFNHPGDTIVYHTRAQNRPEEMIEDTVRTIKTQGIRRGAESVGRPPSVYFTSNQERANRYGFILGRRNLQRAGVESPTLNLRHFVIVEFSIPDSVDDRVYEDYTDNELIWDPNGEGKSFRIETDIPPEWVRSVTPYDIRAEMTATGPRTSITPHQAITRTAPDLGYVVIFVAEGSPAIQRHYGPGPHPGTGSPQSVHGGGGISGEARLVSGIGPRRAHSRARYKAAIAADGITALAAMPQTQTWQPVWEGLEAIDRVHRMPDYMPDLLQRTAKPGQLPFERSMSRIRLGGYWQLNGDGAKKIGIDLEGTGYAEGQDSGHPQVTTVHEVGHFLDNVLFGDPQSGGRASIGRGARVGPPGVLAEAVDQQFEDVIATMRESVDYQGLASQNLALFTVEGMPGQHFEYPPRAAMRVRQPVEMFARGYAQWIALRSGNSTMRAQIDSRNELADRGGPRLQWQWDNFEPIAGAYDRLFRAAGLLRSTP